MTLRCYTGVVRWLLGPDHVRFRLDVVEVNGDRPARKIGAEAIDECHDVLLPE